MKYIDIETWKRKDHFRFFNRMDYPQFNICATIDVTSFLNFTRENKLPFYYSMIFAVTKILNEYDDFKYRIREDKIVLHDTIHPSFTWMKPESEDDLFRLVTVDFASDIKEFAKTAHEAGISQKDYFGLEKLDGRDDLVYITCIPWISFKHLSHTISLNKNDSVPRIAWGKYYSQDNKVLLPFSVQVNHALLDGYHIGKYLEKLQNYLTTPIHS